jgi:hypothetical protein
MDNGLVSSSCVSGVPVEQCQDTANAALPVETLIIATFIVLAILVAAVILVVGRRR